MTCMLARIHTSLSWWSTNMVPFDVALLRQRKQMQSKTAVQLNRSLNRKSTSWWGFCFQLSVGIAFYWTRSTQGCWENKLGWPKASCKLRLWSRWLWTRTSDRSTEKHNGSRQDPSSLFFNCCIYIVLIFSVLFLVCFKTYWNITQGILPAYQERFTATSRPMKFIRLSKILVHISCFFYYKFLSNIFAGCHIRQRKCCNYAKLFWKLHLLKMIYPVSFYVHLLQRFLISLLPWSQLI